MSINRNNQHSETFLTEKGLQQGGGLYYSEMK